MIHAQVHPSLFGSLITLLQIERQCLAIPETIIDYRWEDMVIYSTVLKLRDNFKPRFNLQGWNWSWSWKKNAKKMHLSDWNFFYSHVYGLRKHLSAWFPVECRLVSASVNITPRTWKRNTARRLSSRQQRWNLVLTQNCTRKTEWDWKRCSCARDRRKEMRSRVMLVDLWTWDD